MNRIARFSSTLAAALLVALACAGPRAEPPRGRALPDPEFQSRIDDVVKAVARQDERASERLDALVGFAGQRRRELLLQLALYLADSTGTEQSMPGALILDQLRFTPDEKVDTALPNLRDASEPLRKVLTELLGTVDRPGGAAADFSVYESRLRAAQPSPLERDALIRYMYEVSPDAAVRTLARVHGGAANRPQEPGDQVALLARIVSRHADATSAWSPEGITLARAALEKLSKDPAWWRRAYAAAILREHRELATAALTERLTGDPSPLVRGALSR